MILVLLYKFSEYQDSIIGYRLCEKLVEEGFNLWVTSTSSDEEKQAEIEAARRMTESLAGSVRIIEMKPEILDAPRIFNLQRALFSEPAIPDDIETVIGILPETAETAVELKKMLNVPFVLLAARKVSTTRQNLKTDVIRLVHFADEIWSVGSDIYLHYEGMFREYRKKNSNKWNQNFWLLRHQREYSPIKMISLKVVLGLVFFVEEIWSIGSDIYLYYEKMFRGHRKSKKTMAHKEIMLMPPVRVSNQEFLMKGECGSLLSVWNHGNSHNIEDITNYSEGNTIESFLSAAAAIEKIHEQNLQGSMTRIEWNIHGLQSNEKLIRELQDPRHQYKFPINALESVSSHNISPNQCLAYIAPDVQDRCFSYFALLPLCLGVPTLVSELSSVGQFLRSLRTPLCRKPIVNLTGDFEHDKEAWFRKLQNEIFGKEANPTQWAMELSEYLQTRNDIWKLDLSVLKPRPIPIAHEEYLGLPPYLHRRFQFKNFTGQKKVRIYHYLSFSYGLVSIVIGGKGEHFRRTFN